MASKLSTTQLNYLKWLYQGNTINVFLECFKDTGKIEYSSHYPHQTDKRALENLKRAGMLKFHDEFHFGLQWRVVSLSDKAIKFMEEQK